MNHEIYSKNFKSTIRKIHLKYFRLILQKNTIHPKFHRSKLHLNRVKITRLIKIFNMTGYFPRHRFNPSNIVRNRHPNPRGIFSRRAESSQNSRRCVELTSPRTKPRGRVRFLHRVSHFSSRFVHTLFPFHGREKNPRVSSDSSEPTPTLDSRRNLVWDLSRSAERRRRKGRSGVPISPSATSHRKCKRLPSGCWTKPSRTRY